MKSERCLKVKVKHQFFSGMHKGKGHFSSNMNLQWKASLFITNEFYALRNYFEQGRVVVIPFRTSLISKSIFTPALYCYSLFLLLTFFSSTSIFTRRNAPFFHLYKTQPFTTMQQHQIDLQKVCSMRRTKDIRVKLHRKTRAQK